jgi:5'-3' exonuclease
MFLAGNRDDDPGTDDTRRVETVLLDQFSLLEDVLSAAGILVWPMVEFEADDALAAGAALAARDERVDKIIICTPDKDLAQFLNGTHIIQLNRRTRVVRDEAGVIGQFGVAPLPFRITWLSSAMQPTATPACRAGV